MPKTLPDYPENVRAALRDGKLWRAKEILQGRIAGSSFDPDLYEQYGSVLLQMSELMAAGKYLYLSGKRLPEYEEAIDLFLSRHKRMGWKSFVSTFPSGAKKAPLAAFPPAVREQLRVMGAPDEQPKIHRASGRKAGAVFGATILGVAVISMVIGFFVLVRYLFGLYEIIWK